MERFRTQLEHDEDRYLAQLTDSESDIATSDALLGLGLTHLAMEPRRLRQGAREVMTSMSGRSTHEAIGIGVFTLLYLAGAVKDSRADEYAEAIRADID